MLKSEAEDVRFFTASDLNKPVQLEEKDRLVSFVNKSSLSEEKFRLEILKSE